MAQFPGPGIGQFQVPSGHGPVHGAPPGPKPPGPNPGPAPNPGATQPGGTGVGWTTTGSAAAAASASANSYAGSGTSINSTYFFLLSLTTVLPVAGSYTVKNVGIGLFSCN